MKAAVTKFILERISGSFALLIILCCCYSYSFSQNEPKMQILDSFQFSSGRAVFQSFVEKKLLHPNLLLNNQGNSTLDMLRILPSVSIEADGIVKLRGKPLNVYVNGKPSILNISQIQASQIQSVELYTLPGSDTDASSIGGILDLKLSPASQESNRVLNIGGSLPLVSNLHFSVPIIKKSHSLRADVSSRLTNNMMQIPRQNTVKTATSNFSSDQRSALKSVFTNVVLNYNNQIHSKVNYGLSCSFLSELNHPTISYLAVKEAGPKVESTEGFEKQKASSKSLAGGFRLNYKASERNSLSLETEFTSQSNHSEGFSESRSKDRVILNYAEICNSNSLNQWLSRAELIHSPNTGVCGKIGLFTLHQSSTSQGSSIFWNNLNGSSKYKQTYFKSNNPIENYAVYGNFTKQQNKYKYKIGLRSELFKSQLSMTELGISSATITYPKNLNSFRYIFFPDFSATYLFRNNAELNFSFSRRLNRPTTQQLNPSPIYRANTGYFIGNPTLVPEIVNMLEVNHLQKSSGLIVHTSLYAKFESTPILQYLQPYSRDSTIILHSFANGKEETLIGIDQSISCIINKNLNINLNYNIFNVELEADGKEQKAFAFNGKSIVEIRRGTVAIQSINIFDSRQLTLQGFRKGVFSSDLALQYSLNNKHSLSILLYDIFNTRKEIFVSTLFDTIKTTVFKSEQRRFGIQFKIKF